MTSQASHQEVFSKIETLLELSERNEAYEERVHYYWKAKMNERLPATTSRFSWAYILTPLFIFILYLFIPDWNWFVKGILFFFVVSVGFVMIQEIYKDRVKMQEQERKDKIIYARVLQEDEPDEETLAEYKEEHESLWYDIVMDYNIPEKYQSETHLGDFLYYHQQGRAETLGQAYNVYEQVAHYHKMQQLAERQAEALEKKNEQDAARYKREEERFREQQAKLDDLESEMISTRHAVEEHNDWHRY